MEVITALEICAEGASSAHWHWLGVCDVEGCEEGQESNVFSGKCFLGADFG